MGPAVKTFLILGKKEEGFMPARSLLRPGEEERKTEIETEQEGGGWIWADRVGGSKDRAPENHRPASPSGPAALVCLSHHDSWVPGASHTPAVVLTNPP